MKRLRRATVRSALPSACRARTGMTIRNMSHPSVRRDRKGVRSVSNEPRLEEALRGATPSGSASGDEPGSLLGILVG